MRGMIQDQRWQMVQNLCTDPYCTTFIKTSTGMYGVSSTRWFGVNGTGYYQLMTNVADAPLGITTYARKTWSTAPGTNNGDTGFDVGGEYLHAKAGTPVSVGCWMRSSLGRRFQFSHYAKATSQSGTPSRSYSAALVYGEVNAWQWCSWSTTVQDNLEYFKIVPDVMNSSSSNWRPGDTLDITGVMVSYTPIIYQSTSGDSPGWTWDGAPNASTSHGWATPAA